MLRNPSREYLTTTTLKLLKNLFRRTDAIYSIPWNDCDNKYIGQTKRQFGTRLKERQKVIFFYKKEQSALSEHTGLSLETFYINSAHTPFNRDDGGLLPNASLHLFGEKAAN